MDSFEKGQVFVGGIPSIAKFDIEIPYEDTKYPFQVELLGPELYRFSINGQAIDIEITETAEGALLTSFGGEMHRIVGRVEPLGLRLVLDGVTTLMPDIIDPSELRTDVTGKIVRYLQPNGADVKKGEGYVEVEAMKMSKSLHETLLFLLCQSSMLTIAISLVHVSHDPGCYRRRPYHSQFGTWYRHWGRRLACDIRVG